MDISLDNYVGNLTGMYERNNSTSKLENTISATDYNKATDEELMEVCKQFEAYFLEQVFKGMEKMIPEREDEDSAVSKKVDYFKETMIQQIASDTTETQSVGLARLLYDSMKRQYTI